MLQSIVWLQEGIKGVNYNYDIENIWTQHFQNIMHQFPNYKGDEKLKYKIL